jgi:hypothetical protein
MNALLKHVALPATAPAALVALYFTPVHVFGCVNRGLMAVAVVLVSMIVALVTTAIGVRLRARSETTYPWWLLSTLILILPAALLLGPLG